VTTHLWLEVFKLYGTGAHGRAVHRLADGIRVRIDPMDDAQPSYAEAAAFWNSMNHECRETLLSGYDGLHPWSLAVQLDEAGMLSETVPSPGDRVVSIAEEGADGQPAAASGDGLQLVLARELVRILDRGDLWDVDPAG
jgi:hypothetical protein